MLIVEVKKGNIEKSLKDLKSKVIKTKQNKILFENKEFEKNSVKKRRVIQKATYVQKLRNNN
jgi:small subunit ribosomal protein S21